MKGYCPTHQPAPGSDGFTEVVRFPVWVTGGFLDVTLANDAGAGTWFHPRRSVNPDGPCGPSPSIPATGRCRLRSPRYPTAGSSAISSGFPRHGTSSRRRAMNWQGHASAAAAPAERSASTCHPDSTTWISSWAFEETASKGRPRT